jgi:hypothetical protein
MFCFRDGHGCTGGSSACTSRGHGLQCSRRLLQLTEGATAGERTPVAVGARECFSSKPRLLDRRANLPTAGIPERLPSGYAGRSRQESNLSRFFDPWVVFPTHQSRGQVCSTPRSYVKSPILAIDVGVCVQQGRCWAPPGSHGSGSAFSCPAPARVGLGGKRQVPDRRRGRQGALPDEDLPICTPSLTVPSS